MIMKREAKKCLQREEKENPTIGTQTSGEIKSTGHVVVVRRH
jgi:hypothetical protein